MWYLSRVSDEELNRAIKEAKATYDNLVLVQAKEAHDDAPSEDQIKAKILKAGREAWENLEWTKIAAGNDAEVYFENIRAAESAMEGITQVSAEIIMDPTVDMSREDLVSIFQLVKQHKNQTV